MDFLQWRAASAVPAPRRQRLETQINQDVTELCHRGVGTMRDGVKGKPRLTRGLGARVLCTAPRRGFPHRSLRAICSRACAVSTFFTRALRKRPLRFLGLWETECLRFCASEKTASLAATARMPQMRDQYRAMAAAKAEIQSWASNNQSCC